MKWWNQWTRKRDGWAERKRRFQKMFADIVGNAAGELKPAVANATAPETPPTVRIRGEQ